MAKFPKFFFLLAFVATMYPAQASPVSLVDLEKSDDGISVETLLNFQDARRKRSVMDGGVLSELLGGSQHSHSHETKGIALNLFPQETVNSESRPVIIRDKQTNKQSQPQIVVAALETPQNKQFKFNNLSPEQQALVLSLLEEQQKQEQQQEVEETKQINFNSLSPETQRLVLQALVLQKAQRQ